ncbi:MAG: GNAT family N-acetyltransferase [Bacteroidales bacterium]|nr:GNAT family N-acetyltransferase [Bacteroidales bacterium]
MKNLDEERIKGGLQIHLSIPKDIPDIIRLVRDGFKENIVDKLIYSCKGIDKYIGEQLDDDLSKTKYISVRQGDKMVAFLEYRYLPASLCLNYIVIDKNFRGKGYASVILGKSLELLNSAYKELVLDVFDYNEKALNWYLKKGFVRIGETYWYEILNSVDEAEYEHVAILNKEDTFFLYNMYGFCMLELLSGNKKYLLGLLGEDWIRINSIDILQNKNVFCFLKKEFPKRRLFALLDADIDQSAITGIDYKIILKSYRMSVNLNTIR